MNASFEKMCRRNGSYSLPYLITLSAGGQVIRFVNNNTDLQYEGNTYSAGSFLYTPNAEELGFSGGGSLEIAVIGNSIIDLIEQNRGVTLRVIGALCEDGSVTPITSFSHHYGKVRVTKTKAVFTFEKDDRLDMTFPALIWSRVNNRGNG